MNSIWAVATGEYSDYRVDSIFERLEDAESAIAAGFGGSIEEITFYAAGELPKKVSKIRFFGWIAVTTGEIQRDDSYCWDEWIHPNAKLVRAPIGVDVRPWPFHPRLKVGGAVRMELTVSGDDDDRTRKTYADALAKLRAECIEGLHGGAR